MQAVDPSFHRTLLVVLASWVLFAVFLASAVAFVLMLFNLLTTSAETKKYLFGVFAVSGVSVFVGVAGDFLKFDPLAIQRDAVREKAAEASRESPAGAKEAPITIYTQIGSAKDKGQYDALRNTLAGGRYVLPGFEVVKTPVSENQIRYCNVDNRNDADALKAKLDQAGFNKFTVQKIGNCNAEANRNILEVWLKPS